MASATRKSEDSNHKSFTKRLISETQWGSECPIMLKNMTNFKELFTLSHSSNSRVVYLEVGQMYQENSASTSFSDMFNDENTSDFTIKCQDKYFHVHQLILKKRSEHFSAILRNDLVEMTVKQVVWDDSDPKIVEMLLRYLYNNTVQFKDFDEVVYGGAIEGNYDESLEPSAGNVLTQEVHVWKSNEKNGDNYVYPWGGNITKRFRFTSFFYDFDSADIGKTFDVEYTIKHFVGVNFSTTQTTG